MLAPFLGDMPISNAHGRWRPRGMAYSVGRSSRCSGWRASRLSVTEPATRGPRGRVSSSASLATSSIELALGSLEPSSSRDGNLPRVYSPSF